VLFDFTPFYVLIPPAERARKAKAGAGARRWEWQPRLIKEIGDSSVSADGFSTYVTMS
jgi:hypothetical protein